MLATLSIENFAIIEQLNIDFTQGMTVLAGETGAGKSIIIDALGILCGGRGSTDYIRQGSEKFRIEGQFTFSIVHPELSHLLTSFGIEVDLTQEDLIVHREINVQGKNVIRINGQLANVSLLKKMGYFLVDIHGQNEHQALLDSTQHIQLLDQYGGQTFKDLMTEYEIVFQQFNQLKEEWFNVRQDESDQLQRLNFIEFQADELAEADLVAGEDEQLEQVSKQLQNQQLIITNLTSANQLMSESDASILNQIDIVSNLLEEVQQYNSAIPKVIDQLTSSRYEIEDIAQQIAYQDTSISNEEVSIDDVEARLSELSRLKRKYGLSIEDLITYYQEISEEIYQIKNKDKLVEKLEKDLEAVYNEALALADQLHEKRQSIANQLVKSVEDELQDLYMGSSRFEVRFEPVQKDNQLTESYHDPAKNFVRLTQTGYDAVVFYVATNVGESLKPLVKVASGGELSRYMLALKTVFSSNQHRKVMVFDEIDTGVSGRVAQAIATKIHEISNRHQVLCITHLPQVAAIADYQFYIYKEVDEGRTSTHLKNLSLEERSEVIAQMMSGEAITAASLKLAEELINEYQQM